METGYSMNLSGANDWPSTADTALRLAELKYGVLYAN
jgi:hypothetical protein